MKDFKVRKLDYAQVWENTVTALSNYLEKYKLESMILGVSGGIDSTVVAAICKQVSTMTQIPLIGYSLMCSTNQADEKTAADLVGEAFCDEYYKVNLQETYNNVSTDFEISTHNTTPLAEGNIKARLRMMFLYNVASLRSGIVMDTDNLTEHYLGFWTIHGDEGDLNPIGKLWKHEVYELAKWIRDNNAAEEEMKALNASIALTPTDGNGVQAGGDMAQIAPGYTYEEVDEILQVYVNHDNFESLDDQIDYKESKAFREDSINLDKKYGKDTVERIISRYKKSAFKRRHRPIVIDDVTGLDI
jgi:NAD+ synthetase